MNRQAVTAKNSHFCSKRLPALDSKKKPKAPTRKYKTISSAKCSQADFLLVDFREIRPKTRSETKGKLAAKSATKITSQLDSDVFKALLSLRLGDKKT